MCKINWTKFLGLFVFVSFFLLLTFRDGALVEAFNRLFTISVVDNAEAKNPQNKPIQLPSPALSLQTTLPRTFTFDNKCTQPIWVAASGNTGACVPSVSGLCANPPTCTSSNDCPVNEYCYTELHSSVTLNSCADTIPARDKCTVDADCHSPMMICGLDKTCEKKCVDGKDCAGKLICQGNADRMTCGCGSDADCPNGQFCNSKTKSCWQEKKNFCSRAENDTGNKGGCPPGKYKPGDEVFPTISCSQSTPCPADPGNPGKQLTCNPATNTCWTVGEVGCFCDKNNVPGPACAFRQCAYVPVGGTNGTDTTVPCQLGNQDCGTKVSPQKPCSTNNPCDGDNQYCRQAGNDKFCYWVGGEAPGMVSCSQNTDCTAPLQYCNPTTNTCWAEQYCNSSTNTCFFVATDGNGFKLDAQGGAHDNMGIDIPVTWAGRFWGRTNCEEVIDPVAGNRFVCDTGQCAGMAADKNGNAAFSENCEVSGNPPVTAAEFAMGVNFPDGNTTDYYDVSMTDSANLGLSIVPNPDDTGGTGYNMSINGGIATTGGTDEHGSCTQDSDCPTQQANVKERQVNPMITCSTDSNCPKPPYQFCNTDNTCWESVNEGTFNSKCDTNLGKCVDTYKCGSPGCVDMDGCAAVGIKKSFIEHCPWDTLACNPGSSTGLAVAESCCTADIFGTPINSLKWKCDPSTPGKCGNLSSFVGTYTGCLGGDPACDLGGNPADLNCNGAPKCSTNADCVAAPNVPGSPMCMDGKCVSSNTMNMKELYGCTGPNNASCYSVPNTSPPADDFYFCCGCSAWSPFNNNGKSTCWEIPMSDPYAFYSNIEWEKNAEPIPKIFHDACPQAYGFAYDDKVATFTCDSKKVDDKTVSNVNYTITFCPQL